MNKNSVEPPMTAAVGNDSEKLRTKYICVKVPPRHCLSSSAESFQASIFETGDKRSPTDKLVIRNNKLQHFTQKERN